MTPFEAETGLREEYNNEFTNWRDSIGGRLKEIENIPIEILLWGPGRYSGRHYEKRMQILEHILGLSVENHATTSELLEDQEPGLADYLSLRDREELHALEADLIFILLVSENQVSGPEAEVLSFAYDRRLREKMWISLPKNWNKAGYLAEAVKDFPDERKSKYTFPKFAIVSELGRCVRKRYVSFADRDIWKIKDYGVFCEVRPDSRISNIID